MSSPPKHPNPSTDSLPGVENDIDDASEEESHCPGPFVSEIYKQAFRFKEILNQNRASLCSSDSGHASSLKESDAFAELVGRDLDKAEKAAAAPFSKLHASESTTWLGGDLNAEPNSIQEEGEDEEDVPDLDITDDLEHSDESVIPPSISSEEPWMISPEQAVKLIVDEFGPLAQGDESEELLLEADGVLAQDVSVLGVIHLTTHRLTFHASLLSSDQPNDDSPPGVIKAGPVSIHRTKLRRKRRIWLELSQEMLCAYASSSDDDHIRPIRAVFLSVIQNIYPVDPKHPRLVKLANVPNDIPVTVFELDTQESASEWRRELTGALFLYRHRRRHVFQSDNVEDSPGIRLSIPLDRFRKIEFAESAHLAHIARCYIELPDIESHPFSIHRHRPKVMQLFMGTAQRYEIWSNLALYVESAKARKRSPYLTSPLIIDTGPLSFGPDESEKGITDKLERIRMALGFSPDEEIWVSRARPAHTIAQVGTFVVSRRHVGLWCRSLTQCDTRYRIHTSEIRKARPYEGRLFCAYGMVLEMFAHADLRFDFLSVATRDEAVKRINAVVKPVKNPDSRPSSPSRPSLHNWKTSVEVGKTPPPSPGLKRNSTATFSPLSRTFAAAANIRLPSPYIQNLERKVINLPREILLRRPSLKFACLTIGSRGDVQPYIALGLGLKKEGHHVVIVTHDEYKEWIEDFGLEHRQAGGDPGVLMQLSVENKIFSPEFFKQSLKNFRPWLDQLLLDAWEACKDADVLLESPSAMAGVHIAEALNIPYFRTFTMPWTKTSEFPHAFISPPVEGPAFNGTTYVLFENVMWSATSGQINRWRKNTLKIASTDMGHLAQSKIMFIYNFSQAVVPKPLDWGDTTLISGYWFLDNPDFGWVPPPGLVEFMKKAREDGRPLVYIGFGSITVPHPNRVTARIYEAVVKSNCRAIISKGWSARMSKEKETEVEVPPECYVLDKVPHDWLFPQIGAALHHGGAGTTGASLRAGIPTLIKPWFGDQYFWASRVRKLGAGLRIRSVNVNEIANALIKATSDRTMKEKASRIGERIRSEDGVHTAIFYIYTYLHRASQSRSSLN